MCFVKIQTSVLCLTMARQDNTHDPLPLLILLLFLFLFSESTHNINTNIFQHQSSSPNCTSSSPFHVVFIHLSSPSSILFIYQLSIGRVIIFPCSYCAIIFLPHFPFLFSCALHYAHPHSSLPFCTINVFLMCKKYYLLPFLSLSVYCSEKPKCNILT